MNNGAISFNIIRDIQELSYVSLTLDETKRVIRYTINIIDVAERLGIILRKVQKGENEEYTE